MFGVVDAKSHLWPDHSYTHSDITDSQKHGGGHSETPASFQPVLYDDHPYVIHGNGENQNGDHEYASSPSMRASNAATHNRETTMFPDCQEKKAFVKKRKTAVSASTEDSKITKIDFPSKEPGDSLLKTAFSRASCSNSKTLIEEDSPQQAVVIGSIGHAPIPLEMIDVQQHLYQNSLSVVVPFAEANFSGTCDVKKSEWRNTRESTREVLSPIGNKTDALNGQFRIERGAEDGQARFGVNDTLDSLDQEGGEGKRVESVVDHMYSMQIPLEESQANTMVLAERYEESPKGSTVLWSQGVSADDSPDDVNDCRASVECQQQSPSGRQGNAAFPPSEDCGQGQVASGKSSYATCQANSAKLEEEYEERVAVPLSLVESGSGANLLQRATDQSKQLNKLPSDAPTSGHSRADLVRSVSPSQCYVKDVADCALCDVQTISINRKRACQSEGGVKEKVCKFVSNQAVPLSMVPGEKSIHFESKAGGSLNFAPNLDMPLSVKTELNSCVGKCDGNQQKGLAKATGICKKSVIEDRSAKRVQSSGLKQIPEATHAHQTGNVNATVRAVDMATRNGDASHGFIINTARLASAAEQNVDTKTVEQSLPASKPVADSHSDILRRIDSLIHQNKSKLDGEASPNIKERESVDSEPKRDAPTDEDVRKESLKRIELLLQRNESISSAEDVSKIQRGRVKVTLADKIRLVKESLSKANSGEKSPSGPEFEARKCNAIRRIEQLIYENEKNIQGQKDVMSKVDSVGGEKSLEPGVRERRAKSFTMGDAPGIAVDATDQALVEVECLLVKKKAEKDSVHDHAYFTSNSGSTPSKKAKLLNSGMLDLHLASKSHKKKDLKRLQKLNSKQNPSLHKPDRIGTNTSQTAELQNQLELFNEEDNPLLILAQISENESKNLAYKMATSDSKTGLLHPVSSREAEKVSKPVVNSGVLLPESDSSSRAIIQDHTYEEDKVNTQQFSILRDHSYKKLKKCRKVKGGIADNSGRAVDHTYTPKP